MLMSLIGSSSIFVIFSIASQDRPERDVAALVQQVVFHAKPSQVFDEGSQQQHVSFELQVVVPTHVLQFECLPNVLRVLVDFIFEDTVDLLF